MHACTDGQTEQPLGTPQGKAEMGQGGTPGCNPPFGAQGVWGRTSQSGPQGLGRFSPTPQALRTWGAFLVLRSVPSGLVPAEHELLWQLKSQQPPCLLWSSPGCL